MAEKKNVVTYSGLKKIEEELQNLKVNKRREIAAKIKEAREQGDLSENAEYDAAKDEQRDIEARIEQLEAMLKNIEVVDEDEVDTGVVGIGCKVAKPWRMFGIRQGWDIYPALRGKTEPGKNHCKPHPTSPILRTDKVPLQFQNGASHFLLDY